MVESRVVHHFSAQSVVAASTKKKRANGWKKSGGMIRNDVSSGSLLFPISARLYSVDESLCFFALSWCTRSPPAFTVIDPQQHRRDGEKRKEAERYRSRARGTMQRLALHISTMTLVSCATGSCTASVSLLRYSPAAAILCPSCNQLRADCFASAHYYNFIFLSLFLISFPPLLISRSSLMLCNSSSSRV